MSNNVGMPAYLATVRAAQELAGLLKRSRPELNPQIEELQAIVTRSHARLDELNTRMQESSTLNDRDGRGAIPNSHLSHETAAALTDLEAAYHALVELKHASKSSTHTHPV